MKKKKILPKKKRPKPAGKQKKTRRTVWKKPFEFGEDDLMNSGRSLFPYDHEDV